MKKLFIVVVSYFEYLNDPPKETRTVPVWADSQEEAEDIIRVHFNISRSSSWCIIDTQEALGSPLSR